MRTIAPFFLLSLCLPLSAQTPYLVRDINTTYSDGTASSSPGEFAAYRNKVFFSATANGAGTELWSTDGTSGGTTMVADIIPGTGSSEPNAMNVVGSALLFNARDVNHGVELWATDGSAAGTQLLIDINPGPSSSLPGMKTPYKNRMLFTADDGTTGRELWITDGTAGGTHIVKDINAGAASSSPSNLVTFGGNVYFSATGALWKTDGTESGTVKVATVPVRQLAVAGSQLFFQGSSSPANWELWVSDGSETGTRLVTEILPGPKGALDGPYSLPLNPFGSRMLFVANDDVHGREMWISDGSAAGTQMVRDFIPGQKGMWDTFPTSIATVGERAYFTATDDVHGTELWVTDGTDTGTALFDDIIPGVGSPNLSLILVSGSKLYFATNTGASLGPRLWVTDGTQGGTHMLEEVGLGYVNFRLWPINGNVYFDGTTSLSGGEPWVTDGTQQGSRMIANLASDRTPSSRPRMFTPAGGLLFFYAMDGLGRSSVAELSLWRSDGTAAGTFKLATSEQNPWPLMAAGPLVFFIDATTSKLMMSDGTVQGTVPADSFMQRFGGAKTGPLFALGDSIFTAVYDKLSGVESSLWKTTVAPDAPAIRLGPINPTKPVEMAGRFFFFGLPSIVSQERSLWMTDGTVAGTYALIPGAGNSREQLGSLGSAIGMLFFVKQNDGSTDLWKSDGTADGTTVVKELAGLSLYNTRMKAAGRSLFLESGDSVWAIDGSEAGTIEVAHVHFRSFMNDDHLVPLGSRIVFAPFNDTTGYEVWSSDGTKNGTKRLAVAGKSQEVELTAIDGLAYFAGTDEQHGTEIWTTDGTAEGTKLFLDLNPGPASSNPTEFAKAGNLLYFSAYTDGTGAELWALPLTEASVSISDVWTREGTAGTATARFAVSVGNASNEPITVDYATVDGTAKADDDYVRTSGTLTFAPGETTKTIDVSLRGDAVPEGNETFFVSLTNARAARIVVGDAAGIIEDDDAAADLRLATRIDESGSSLAELVTVANQGPRAATNVVVKVSSTNPSDPFETPCTSCAIPQLLPGASAMVSPYAPSRSQQVYLSATATARETDPQLGNNTTTWTINGSNTIAMDAAYLVPGKTATVTARFFRPDPAILSSDPSVILISPLTKTSDRLGTFTVTALKPGTSTINVDDGRLYPLLVTVIPAGTSPRWPAGMSLSTEFSQTRFDKPVTATLSLRGIAPGNGATPGGAVVITAGGRELARRIVTAEGVLRFPLYFPALGSITYQASYSGDENFLPETTTGTIFVTRGLPGIAGHLEPVTGSAGTFALTVTVVGSPFAAPTGVLTIFNGSTELGKLSLIPGSDGISRAFTMIQNLPLSPSLTASYAGDAFYDPSTQQITLAQPRRRAVRR